jgi:hypothetical protein
LRRYATLAGPNGPAPDAFLFFIAFSLICGLCNIRAWVMYLCYIDESGVPEIGQ